MIKLTKQGIESMTKTLTVVYQINDEKEFKEHRAAINENFKMLAGEPWAVTAMSLGHEIHRLSLIEEAHENDRLDLLTEIFGLIDPGAVASITDLGDY